MKYKYIVYEPMNNQVEYFETMGEAKEYAVATIEDTDGSGGFPEEYIDGNLIIARITHKSKFNEIDRKSNYPCLKDKSIPAFCESGCEDKECEGTEEWYTSEFDICGELVMEELNKEEEVK